VYQARLENAPKLEQEYQSLARDYEATKDIYHGLQRRSSESQLAESADNMQALGEVFKVIEPGLPATSPAGPARPILLAIGFFAALCLGSTMIAVREFSDLSVRDREALRRCTSLPVLANIPPIITPADQAILRRRRWLGAVSVCAAVIVLAAGSHMATRHNWRLTSALVR
jgi:succinoglycan biosynthesis transport protein ExoP